MKDSIRRVLETLLESDETITSEQIELVLGVLDGRELKEMTKEVEPYLTLREVGKRLGISPCSLWRWKVPGHEFGGRRRFRMSEVEAYLQSREMKRRAKDLRAERRDADRE